MRVVKRVEIHGGKGNEREKLGGGGEWGWIGVGDICRTGRVSHFRIFQFFVIRQLSSGFR